MLLFDFEISDKPIKDSSFNQCLWQLKKNNGIMGKFTELLTNSDEWKSSRCTMEWNGIKNNNIFIFVLGLDVKQGLLPTPKHLEAPSASWEKRKPNGNFKAGITLTDMKNWEMLPSPKNQKFEGTIEIYEKLKNKKNIVSILNKSQLNPKFVLEMMGFPIDFTEKPFNNVVV